jgi:outer membrane receptor for ferric coprogen and ferric-rhodotorulic acid
MSYSTTLLCRRLAILAPACLLALTPLRAQRAPAATPDAATLAKYDTNKNGKLDPDEIAAMEAAQKTAIPVKSQPASTPADTEVVALSPFEVTSEANRGYFQSNTMSGTRLNSKIEDLGQSITVMTKDQMQDFAMLDINDVFDHMASTEGTNSYSQFDTDRTGAVVDQVSLNPNNANRVRGIGNANIAFNNIQTSGRVPVDPLWLDSLELSRGPNANIFGLGNASGTVNQVPATANLSRDFSKVEFRGDSYGGWRGSLDLNRELFQHKLAVRASYADQHNAFIRKPSGEDQRRLSFQLKARPFKNTTLSASWYNYKNVSVRPNFTTPRDYYTDWVRAGKPG